MKYRNEDIAELKNLIIPVLKKHRVKKAALFGSFVRGEAKESSDIDILVDVDENISLLDFVGIKLDLEEVLGRKVDLVEYGTIKPRLRERILKEQVVIL